MITKSRYSPNVGQDIEEQFILSDTVQFDFENQYINFKDPVTQQIMLRFLLVDGLIKYQRFDQGQWQPEQSLTPSVINPNDNNILPHNGGSNNIIIDQNGLQITLQSVQKYILSPQKIQLYVPNIEFAPQFSDISITFDNASNQKFNINTQTRQLFSISAQKIDLDNLQIIGLQDSTENNSAVSRQQLLNFKPNYLQINNQTGVIQIINVENSILMTISSTSLSSNIKLKYNQHPQSFQNTELVDAQYVQEYINQTITSQKGQPNGFTSLNNSSKVFQNQLQNDLISLQSTLKTLNGIPITTDFIMQGNNKYYTDSQVNSFIQTIKGQQNGICPLNSNVKIDTQYLPAFSSNQVFVGDDADKILPSKFAPQIPNTGAMYIATDTSITYILSASDFTISQNWVQLAGLGVNMVNGQTGIVSLNTDNIPEGVQKYFVNGVSDYLLNQASQNNQLLKLNNQAQIDKQHLNNSLELNNGTFSIYDDQTGNLIFRLISGSDPVLKLFNQGITAYKTITYNTSPTIIDNNDITNKQYVDNSIQSINTIQQSGAFVQVTSEPKIVANVNNIEKISIDSQQITAKTQLLYDSNVAEQQDRQLITKKYVDDLFHNFILNSGAEKQYLQIVSDQLISQPQQVQLWYSIIQSQQQTRIILNGNDTVSLQAGTYRFYAGIQINDLSNVVGGNIRASIKNSTETTTFYDFIINSIGSGALPYEITQVQPFILQFASNTDIALFVTQASADSRIIKSMLMIEEFVTGPVSIGQDRITNIIGNTSVLATNNNITAQIQNTPYIELSNNNLTLSANIKAIQNINTQITENNQLVTKQYVDNAVNVPVVSINKIGQIIQLELTSDQTTGLNIGGSILFNAAPINTSTTMQLISPGVIQFTGGFVYKIDYQIQINFSTMSSLVMFALVDETQTEVLKSKQYTSAPSASLDSSASCIQFLLDLRQIVGTKNYSVQVRAVGGSIQRVYSQFSRFIAQQVQEIDEILQDRIQNIDQTSEIKLQNQELKIKLNGQSISNFVNVNNGLSIADSNSASFVEMNSSQQYPVNFKMKPGLDPSISITDPQQLLTKQYVETNFAPLDGQGMIPAQYVPDTFPIGVVTAFYGSSIPNNWLLCNGSTFSSVTYPDLFAFLGTTTLPDFRGYFLRGLDTSGSVDPQTGRTIGSLQADAFATHNHGITVRNGTGLYSFGVDSIAGTDNSGSDFTKNTNATGSAETRPKNKAVNYIIKAKQQASASQPAISKITNTADNTKVQVNDSNQTILTNNSIQTALITSTLIQPNVTIRYNSNIGSAQSIPQQDYDLTTKAYVDLFQKDFINIYSPFVVQNNGIITGFIIGQQSQQQNKISFNTNTNVLILETGIYEITGTFLVQNSVSFVANIDLQTTLSQTIMPFSNLWRKSIQTQGETQIVNTFLLNIQNQTTSRFLFSASPGGNLIQSNLIIKQL